MTSYFATFREHIKAVSDGMRIAVERHCPDQFSLITDALHLSDDPHFVGSKRLRGTIALCFTAVDDYSWSSEHCVAAAIPELIHAASLILDDLQDMHDTRWGRPTLWKQHGQALAMNTVLTLLALAQVLAERNCESLCERPMEVVLRMLSGQAADLNPQELWRGGIAAYIKIAAGKTCAILSYSVEIGGGLKLANEFRGWAYCLGIAHQIHDDLDDVEGGVFETLGDSNVIKFLREGSDLSNAANATRTARFCAEFFAVKAMELVEESSLPTNRKSLVASITEMIGMRGQPFKFEKWSTEFASHAAQLEELFENQFPFRERRSRKG